MRRKGLQNVQMLEMPGATPTRTESGTQAKGRPTLLLYAHHDVQPTGEKEKWAQAGSVRTRGAGRRLFARGAATTRRASWCTSPRSIPAEGARVAAGQREDDRRGEEESGSGSLPAFLKKHRDLLQADAIVLTDTAKLRHGLPSITTALRGLVTVQVEVMD